MVNTIFPQRGILCAYGDSLYAFFCYRRYRTIKPNNSKDLPINEEIKHYSGEEEDDDTEFDGELKEMYGTVLDERKILEEAV